MTNICGLTVKKVFLGREFRNMAISPFLFFRNIAKGGAAIFWRALHSVFFPIFPKKFFTCGGPKIHGNRWGEWGRPKHEGKDFH